MPTSESLYNAVVIDEFNKLTPGSYVDYGFDTTTSSNHKYLFGAYQSISKFMPKELFIKKMHDAYISEKLHETVEELTQKIPEMFQNHWKNFINNGGKIKPIYI
jgi:hypothetical protein